MRVRLTYSDGGNEEEEATGYSIEGASSQTSHAEVAACGELARGRVSNAWRVESAAGCCAARQPVADEGSAGARRRLRAAMGRLLLLPAPSRG